MPFKIRFNKNYQQVLIFSLDVHMWLGYIRCMLGYFRTHSSFSWAPKHIVVMHDPIALQLHHKIIKNPSITQ